MLILKQAKFTVVTAIFFTVKMMCTYNFKLINCHIIEKRTTKENYPPTDTITCIFLSRDV